MLVYLYMGQLILNMCNKSIIFNSYNFNLNLPNLSVLTVHVCSWIENKNKSYLIPILHQLRAFCCNKKNCISGTKYRDGIPNI